MNRILKALSPARLKWLLIVLPMVLGALYYGLLAADRYESVATVGLRQAGGDGGGALSGAAVLLTGVASPAREDTLYLREYVHSLGLLLRLETRLKLREHYQAPKSDPIYRLWADSPREDFLEYYRKRVTVSLDDMSSTLTLRVQGFEPAFAQALNAAILEESERFVNEYSHKIARDNLAFADGELERAGQRLQKARSALLGFQNKYSLVDPAQQAQAAGLLTTDLQAQISKAETELRNLRSFLQEDAPQVRTQRTQLNSLRAQLSSERQRATGDSKRSDRLNALAIDYQGLQLQAEVAQDAYKTALMGVEAARVESTRKLRSLVVIEPPSTPESAEYPRRFYSLLTLLAGCILIFGVARLTLATIQEHQD
jgi:capsular polysaccharide transport system permease protein